MQPRRGSRHLRAAPRAARRRGALYRQFLAARDFDLVVLGFYEGHKASHRFWDYRAEARSGDLAREDAELAHAIRDLYEATDREIGATLDLLPPDANVVVISLYGMKDEYSCGSGIRPSTSKRTLGCCT
ncbi:MAG: hypothetical protein ACR2GT_07470 [Gaiellaceae bacterium]